MVRIQQPLPLGHQLLIITLGGIFSLAIAPMISELCINGEFEKLMDTGELTRSNKDVIFNCVFICHVSVGIMAITILISEFE